MEELYYSKSKRSVPISHYDIERSRIISKSCFKDNNRIDTVKPGTFLGFCDSKDKLADTNKIK